jgi:microcystin degradation protein MlrC
MGDNPTAGGAGDVTWTLNELMKRKEFKKSDGPSVIYASIPGPELTKKAIEIGVGNEVEAFVGAQVDNRYSPPIKIKGKITAIKHGDKYAETEVVVQSGSINIIVTKKRKPYHKLSDFTELNINPKESDIIIVKIGYLVPELYNIKKGWTMALTPGGVNQDLERLDYKRIKRPMFPLDNFKTKPDLRVKMVNVSMKK